MSCMRRSRGQPSCFLLLFKLLIICWTVDEETKQIVLTWFSSFSNFRFGGRLHGQSRGQEGETRVFYFPLKILTCVIRSGWRVERRHGRAHGRTDGENWTGEKTKREKRRLGPLFEQWQLEGTFLASLTSRAPGSSAHSVSECWPTRCWTRDFLRAAYEIVHVFFTVSTLPADVSRHSTCIRCFFLHSNECSFKGTRLNGTL